MRRRLTAGPQAEAHAVVVQLEGIIDVFFAIVADDGDKAPKTTTPKQSHRIVLNRTPEGIAELIGAPLAAEQEMTIKTVPGVKDDDHALGGGNLAPLVRGRSHESVAVGAPHHVAALVPVDVVEFESFSALRSRVRALVDARGVSPQRRSDGVPHLKLDL